MFARSSVIDSNQQPYSQLKKLYSEPIEKETLNHFYFLKKKIINQNEVHSPLRRGRPRRRIPGRTRRQTLQGPHHLHRGCGCVVLAGLPCRWLCGSDQYVCPSFYLNSRSIPSWSYSNPYIYQPTPSASPTSPPREALSAPSTVLTVA